MVLTFKKFVSWFLEAGPGLSTYESHGLSYVVQAAFCRGSKSPSPLLVNLQEVSRKNLDLT